MSEINLDLRPVDSQELEKIACAKARGGAINSSWTDLIQDARQLLQPLLSWPYPRRDDLDEAVASEPFMVAARILAMAAQWMPGLDKSDRHIQKQTALLSALSYAALGNFPSASAVLKRTFPTLRPQATRQAALMALAAPGLLRDIEKHCPEDEFLSCFFQALTTFLQSGHDFGAVQDAWQNLTFECEDDFARLGQVCLEQIFSLSTARLLKQKAALSEAYIMRLASHIPLLIPPQHRLLHEGLLDKGNTIFSLPPGTGKTLLGELCLMDALGKEPGVAVFLAPYVTLGRQVARTLEKHLPSSIRIRRALGGESPLFQPDEQQILVATPEKFDGLLRAQPQLMEYLRIVVCDEAHLIGGDARGARLEGLLTRLRLQQKAGHSLRLVLLSAALGKSPTLREWMEARVFTHDWRPTAQRIALWTNDGRLTWKNGATAGDAFTLPLPWPHVRIAPTNHWPAVERQTKLLHANAAYLAKHLNESLGGAVLCVCATRRGTRQMAQALTQFFSPREPHGALAKAIDIIEKRHRVLWSLADALRHCVAWHNASLPHDVRNLIEEALENGELEAVASTTTLAEGADFPFRATIMVDWLHWSGNGQQPLAPALFRNIAGRCGRAGAFIEGDTVILDNPLGNLEFTAPEVRHAHQEQSFFAPLPVEVESTFEKLSDAGPFTDLLRATLTSQFLATIAENDGVANLIEDFKAHCYAVRRGVDLLGEMEIISRQLQEGSFAKCVAGGAWHLLDLGRAANQSELSPTTCQFLLHTLHRLKGAALPQNLTQRIAFVGAQLLRELGTCPEQSHADLKNVLLSRRSRFCVKPDDFELVLQLWLRGESAPAIFRALPFTQRSSRQVNIEEWVEGEAARDEAASSWQNELDKFVDFSRHVLEVFLPWILRASERLAPFAEAKNLLNWSQAAHYVESGVDSDWALAMLQNNAPGTRKSWAALGRHEQNYNAALKEVGGKYCDDGQDLIATIEWLQEQNRRTQ